MAQPPKVKKSTPRKKSESGLIGGPSTFRGTTYQVDHAVSLLLVQISETLADPFTPRFITIEPRTTTPNVARWDILSRPPEVTYEAKFNPKRDELLDWLKLVGQSAAGAPLRRFRFVYAEEREAASLIRTVRALTRIAGEFGAGATEFEKMVDHEDIKGADEVRALLGADAIQTLLRIELEQLSDYKLGEYISLRVKHLTSPDQADRLRAYLFDLLQRRAPSRAILAVDDIIIKLRAEGFTLYPPQQIDIQALSVGAHKALIVLQKCKSGLPAEVIASVLGQNQEAVEHELNPISQVSFEDGLYFLAPLGAPLAHPEAADLLAKALQELLSYIRSYGKSLPAKRQVANAIALAEACLPMDPRMVAGVFGALDKLLKEIGRKHLVRDVAELSISAARRTNAADRDMKLAIIRSLICGLTWYYQRIGDLDEANAAASKSLRFARDLDSKIDIAFSLKCTGRLRRIEAEGLTGNARQAKLAESLGMLGDAIETFNVTEGHGPMSPEVGDCYSLMARTHLVGQELHKAKTKLQHAFARIKDDGSKDQIDALILAGDVEMEGGDNEQALSYYDQAVAKAQSDGRDVTEMRARALLHRGRVKKARGDQTGAESDFKDAARIWEQLEEPIASAEAEFEAVSLSTQLSESDLRILLQEPPAVRLQALNLHAARVGQYQQKQTKAAGRRAQLPPKYWDDLIKQARGMVALEGI